MKNKSAYDRFREATMESVRKCMLRGRLELCTLDQPLALSEIEPASEIVKRFATGAMSFGSISLESHQSLAIAMNKVVNSYNINVQLCDNNFHYRLVGKVILVKEVKKKTDI